MTASSFLVRPTAVFRQSYLDALCEGFNGGSSIPLASEKIAAIADAFDAHLAALDKDGQTPHVEEGRTLASVPSNAFWLVDGGEFVGGAYFRARIDLTFWPVSAAISDTGCVHPCAARAMEHAFWPWHCRFAGAWASASPVFPARRRILARAGSSRPMAECCFAGANRRGTRNTPICYTRSS